MRPLVLVFVLATAAGCDSSEPAEAIELRFQAVTEGRISGPLNGRAYADGDAEQWVFVFELDVEERPGTQSPNRPLYEVYGGMIGISGPLRPGVFAIDSVAQWPWFSILLPVTDTLYVVDGEAEIVTRPAPFEVTGGSITVERTSASGTVGTIDLTLLEVVHPVGSYQEAARLSGTFGASPYLPLPIQD
jgi:hypothetical protein